jgi:aminoglycoside 6'-N-acetyltransferase I
MRVRRTTDVEDEDWINLRREFIPELDKQGQVDFLRAFASTLPLFEGFIALDERERAVGFAEASVRTEPVNGCRPGRVAFLEGIYVQPGSRQLGYAKTLCLEVERWAANQDCREFASDVLDDDANSLAAHKALGFTETERSVFFHKPVRAEFSSQHSGSK